MPGFIYIVLLVVFGLSVLYSIASFIYQTRFSPLRKYPGPKFATFSRLPFIYHTSKGDAIYWIHKLHTKYGDIVRIAPDELSYATDGWKDIYGHVKHGQKGSSKDRRFYGPSFTASEIIRSNDIDHARYRRVFSNAFSDRALRQQESLIKTYVDQLITRLHNTVDRDPTVKVDIVKLYNFTTFDIMSDLTFGDPLRLLEGADYNEWVASIFSSVKFTAITVGTRYYPVVAKLSRILTPKPILEKRRSHLAYCAQRVDRRIEREKEGTRPDIWGLVLNQKSEERQLSLHEMYANSNIFMVAGTETTATLLSGLTYLLLTNPAKLDKLTTEIRGAFGSDDDINVISVAGLEYLQACLEEGLRMYPPVPSGLPRVSPLEGKTICGQWVPGKTVMSIHQYSTYRNPNNFKHPNSFVPERWTGDPEFKNDNRSCLQPFSFGPRNCLGKNLAYHEMRLILSKVLYHFDFSLCEESMNWEHQRAFIIWQKSPLWVKLSPRITER